MAFNREEFYRLGSADNRTEELVGMQTVLAALVTALNVATFNQVVKGDPSVLAAAAAVTVGVVMAYLNE